MGLTGTPGGIILGGGSLPTPGSVGTPLPGDINRPGVKDPTSVPTNTKEGEDGQNKADKQKQNKPPKPRKGEMRWDEKLQRWVDDARCIHGTKGYIRNAEAGLTGILAPGTEPNSYGHRMASNGSLNSK